MFEIHKKTNEQILAEKIVDQVFSVIKMYNPKTLIGWSNQDIAEIADTIVAEYLSENLDEGREALEKAIVELKMLARVRMDINIGDFLRFAYSQKKLINDAKESKRLLHPSTRSNLAYAKENLTKIKEMLLNSDALKKLPYDPSYRVISNEVSYQTHAQSGQIKAIEDVHNPELKRLYKKAWDVGLSLSEKNTFYELLKKYC